MQFSKNCEVYNKNCKHKKEHKITWITPGTTNANQIDHNIKEMNANNKRYNILQKQT